MRNSLCTINHKKHNWPGILKHCIGLIVGNFFYSMGFPFFSNSCSIIDGISFPLRLKLSYNIISCCSKLIFYFSQFFSHKSIEKGRFSSIWLPNNSKSDSIVRWSLGVRIIRMRFSSPSIELRNLIFQLCKISLSLCTNSNNLSKS